MIVKLKDNSVLRLTFNGGHRIGDGLLSVSTIVLKQAFTDEVKNMIKSTNKRYTYM